MKRSVLVGVLVILAVGAVGATWAVAKSAIRERKAISHKSLRLKIRDTTPPNTTITEGPEAGTTATSASFAFVSSEPKSAFSCKLDGGRWGRCSSPRYYQSLSLGTHQFSVRATDSAGNTDATPASQTWTVSAPAPAPDPVPAPEPEPAPAPAPEPEPTPEPEPEPVPPADTVAPETNILSGPAASTTATTAGFSFTSSEVGSTFACKLDAGAWAACVLPLSLSALALGTHLFSVRATDAAGNTDTTPASQSWEVISPPPPPPPTETEACDQTVSSVSAAQSALGSAPLDSVVCLSDGSYGSLSLSVKRAAPGVTLRAQNPGKATLGGVSIS